MDEIIVAKKAKGSYGALLFVVILGAVLIALAAALAVLLIISPRLRDFENIFYVIIYGIGSIVIFAVGLYTLDRYKNTPENMIKYKDGLFEFADGTTCKPDEITFVSTRGRYGRYGSLTRTGRLEITINGARRIKYNYVMRVEEANNAIQKIKNEYYANLLNQMQNSKSEN